jgi:hypothetical protein
VIELLIEGRLGIVADGQVELPKEPPFAVLTPGPAAIVHLELAAESPNCIRLFDHLYHTGQDVDVVVHDGKGMWIRAAMQCVALERHAGIQVTRAWSEPLRSAALKGRCVLYRPSPRYQPIARDVYRYTLHAQRWWRVGPATADAPVRLAS